MRIPSSFALDKGGTMREETKAKLDQTLAEVPEEIIRQKIAGGVFDEAKKNYLEAALASRERSRKESSQAEQMEISRSAKDAAWAAADAARDAATEAREANKHAKRANIIAALAIVVAIIALIVSGYLAWLNLD